jgi:thymidylate kinase
MEARKYPRRGPFITIEGVDNIENHRIGQHLSSFMRTTMCLEIPYQQNSSNIGQLLFKHGCVDNTLLPEIAYNHLKIANMWEIQEDLKRKLSNKWPVILTKYVLTNRAQTLSAGNLDLTRCTQLEEGLIQPDLQIYVKNLPQHFNNRPLDSEETRKNRLALSNAFDLLASRDPKVKIVENNDPRMGLLDFFDQTVEIYKQLDFDNLIEYKYFDGVH